MRITGMLKKVTGSLTKLSWPNLIDKKHKPHLSEPNQQKWQYALAGGDDYELCFTVPKSRQGVLAELSADLALPLTRIGQIVAGEPRIEWQFANEPRRLQLQGWDHFKEST